MAGAALPPMHYPDARILIFAKAPEPGEVKTRLIPALGAVAAAELYRRLLLTTVARVTAAALCPVQCWCAPEPPHPFFEHLGARYGVSLYAQTGTDLGERMQRAAQSALEQARSVLLIGGDCPELGERHLRQALAWLSAGEDAVVGPAEDGGYVLLGLKRTDDLLFSAIPWGTEEVLGLTRQRLRVLGWRWRELETLWDLDRPSDLKRWPSAAAILSDRSESDQP